jgi:acylpyruvate hydrolase
MDGGMSGFMLKVRGIDGTNGGGITEIEAGKIICLAQNYPKHAAEMKSTLPALPYFFLKPGTVLINSDEPIVLPNLSREVHHEVELAVIIGKEGKNIPEEQAMSHILGYAVFLDLTARDIQSEGKKTSRPFGISKSFDTFGPISTVTPADRIADPMDLTLHLEVNGEVRQHSSTGLMLYGVKHLITFLSKVMTLEPGDIIATGTPHGVSEIKEGDSVYANIDGVGALRHTVLHE